MGSSCSSTASHVGHRKTLRGATATSDAQQSGHTNKNEKKDTNKKKSHSGKGRHIHLNDLKRGNVNDNSVEETHFINILADSNQSSMNLLNNTANPLLRASHHRPSATTISATSSLLRTPRRSAAGVGSTAGQWNSASLNNSTRSATGASTARAELSSFTTTVSSALIPILRSTTGDGSTGTEEINLALSLPEQLLRSQDSDWVRPFSPLVPAMRQGDVPVTCANFGPPTTVVGRSYATASSKPGDDGLCVDATTSRPLTPTDVMQLVLNSPITLTTTDEFVEKDVMTPSARCLTPICQR